MKKKFAAMALATAMIVTSLTGCGNENSGGGEQGAAAAATESEGESGDTSGDAGSGSGLSTEVETLKVYMPLVGAGNTADLEKVEAAINEYIEPLVYANIDLTYIPYSQWQDQMNMTVASGEQVDLMCSCREISGYYKNGALTPLDDLLENYGQGIKEYLEDIYFGSCTFGGEIYGVPTIRDMAKQQVFEYSVDVAEKYGLEMKEEMTLDELDEQLVKMKEQAPEIPCVLLTNGVRTFDSWCGWDGAGDPYGVVMMGQQDVNLVNLFESDEYVDLLHRVEKWFNAGIINQDAPTADIQWADINPMSPITNTRTFGSDPELIRKMAKAYMKGAHESGVAVTLKHWPGDGKDFRDQHMCSTVNTCTVEEWDNTYRKNYQELIDEGADAIMAAHIRLPEYSRKLNPGIADEDILPGSLSYDLTTRLLRDDMGFNGVVISDASQMAGFTMFMKRKDAVPASIAAGVDMFMFTICHEEDVEAMMEGVRNGVITPERLDEAVTRILGMKASLKLHERKENHTLVPSLDEAKKIIGCQDHMDLARKCADEAVTLVKNKGNVIPISPERNKRVLLRIVNNEPGYFNTYDKLSQCFKDLLTEEGFEVTDYAEEHVPCLNVSTHSVQEMTEKFDLILYLVNVGMPGEMRFNRIMWKNGMQFDVPKFPMDIPEVMVSIYNPYHLMDAQMVPGYINAYSPTETVVREVVKKLVGKSEFKGTSPVDAFCRLWDTRL